MKTPADITNFITLILMKDPNFIAITHQHDITIQTPEGTVTTPNLIELFFNDLNEIECLEFLTEALQDFLRHQPFKVIFGNGPTLLVLLP